MQQLHKAIFILCLIFCNLTIATTSQRNSELNYSTEIAQNLIPMRDFFKNPEKANFQVSPKGNYISFLQPWRSRLNIFVQKLNAARLPEGEPIQVTFVSDRDIADYGWKGEDLLLYVRDFGGDENYHLFSTNINTKTEKDLTPFKDVRVDMVDDLDRISDTDVLIQTNQRNPEIFDVYRLNVFNGDLKMVAENPGKIDSWYTDHEGIIRAATESDGTTSKVYTRENENQQFSKILEFDYKDDFMPLLYTPDNALLYARSNLNRDRRAIVKVDPKTGQEIELVFDHPEVDSGALGYSKKRKVITAASFITWKLEYKFFDKIAKKRYENIKKQVGNQQISIQSLNDDEDLFTVVVYSDTNPGSYYLYDQTKNRMTKLADAQPWLNSDKLAKMVPIQYKSRDGLTIHGYLTLPKGSTGKNIPVIVNPHGGPWARDVWGYDSETQFLANRGYAVIQLNYRGSVGYGKEFWEKSFKQWGLTMQDDITDGVKWLIDQGIANPKKVAIYGASYGGYATLAGITFTPDLYACAIDYVGISNLFTFMNTIPPYWQLWKPRMYAMVGDPVQDKVLLEATSPVFHADQIKTPLFVAQGAKDPRVNINESNQIVETLRKRGVDVEYMVKENEGHGFRNEENRFDFYAAMEKFLHQHLLANN